MTLNFFQSFLPPLWAIALLTIRRSWRNGVLPLLVVLLPAGIFTLRFIVKGDGSLLGMVELWLTYAMAWSNFILSAAALLLGAAAISIEVAARRLQLTKVKPASAATIWLGHWTGLMIMLCGLLCITSFSLQIGLNIFSDSEIYPAAEKEELSHTLKTAQITLIPRMLNSESSEQRTTLPPGAIAYWRVKIPKASYRQSTGSLQFEFITTRPEDSALIPLKWQIKPDNNAQPLLLNSSAPPRKPTKLALPPELLRSETVLTIACANFHPDTSATLLFPYPQGLVVLLPQSGFAANLFKANLIILARLMFLLSLGLTAGSVFSFPVAGFLAATTPLLAVLNSFSESGSKHWKQWAFDPDAPLLIRMLDFASLVSSRIVHWLIPSFKRFNPVDFLNSGTAIMCSLVGNAGLLMGIYSLLLAGAGIYFLAHRQLGLPEI